MSSNYLYPSIISVISGYECTLVVPHKQLKKKLLVPNVILECEFSLFFDGELYERKHHELPFENYEYKGTEAIKYVSPILSTIDRDKLAYLEMKISVKGGEQLLNNKTVVSFYAIYTKDGEKSFFSDGAYKYGDPQIIEQMRTYRRYVITYPVINVDLNRGRQDTLILINPYQKPIFSSFITNDGREVKNKKIPPFSAIFFSIKEQIMKEGESAWSGHLQLTANNRLVTYIIKHVKDERDAGVSDLEHLDPFRSDHTHVSGLLRLRQKLGGKLGLGNSRYNRA